MLENKNSITKVKNDFDMLINRLDMTEEIISALEDILVASSKTEKQREQQAVKTNKKPQNNIQGLWDNYENVTYVCYTKVQRYYTKVTYV